MTADDLLAGIRDGDAHFGGIRCLRLFRIQRDLAVGLRDEIDRLRAVETCSDVSHTEHVTHWAGARGAVRQYSLLNASGDFADYGGDHDLSCRRKRFHHADRYPLLARFVGQLVHAVNVRVNVLGTGAALSPHEEHSLFVSATGTAAVRARFHLPIRTCRAARMLLDGELHRFSARTIYYFNQGCVHAAENPSPCADRVHLVWDQILTAEVFELMFGSRDGPAGWRRVLAPEREMSPVGLRPVTDYVRLPPLVTRSERESLGLGRPQ